jgi:hypothetical protein
VMKGMRRLRFRVRLSRMFLLGSNVLTKDITLPDGIQIGSSKVNHTEH